MMTGLTKGILKANDDLLTPNFETMLTNRYFYLRGIHGIIW